MSRVLAALGLLLVWAVPALAQPAQTKPPLEVYGKLPSIEAVAVSPDGRQLAVITSQDEQRLLAVRSFEDPTAKSILRVGDRKVRWLRWAGDGRLLIATSQTKLIDGLSGPKSEYMLLTDYDLKSEKQTLLLDKVDEGMNVVLDYPQVRIINGAPIAFVQGVKFHGSEGWNTLFRVDLAKKTTKTLEYGGSSDTNDWLVSADGEPLAQTLYEQKTGEWSLKLRSQSGWSTVEKIVSPTGSRGLTGLGRDGRSVLVSMEGDDDETELFEYSPDGAKTPVEAVPGYLSVLNDPATGAMIGQVGQVGGVARYSFLDPKRQKQWDSVVKAYPGDLVTLTSRSNDQRRWVVEVDSAEFGPAFALVDLDTGKADWLGNTYAALTPEAISPVRSIRYKAADGLEINGFLTLPRGRNPKNLPLIVLPHGGPEGGDTPGFDWWSQALASRGYAVLRPNFRGSDGYGRAFVEAGFGEWGKKMQTDLSDGVRHIAAEGLIDPKRVCIVGASYGGYAALAGVTLDAAGTYRCAVSVAGVSDLKQFLLYSQRQYGRRANEGTRYWLRFMGADGVKDPDLAPLSPANLADRVSAPVLLIHGKDDTVVPYDQSERMVAALKKAGKPVEFVTLAGEDHWLSREASRLQMLKSVIAFLATNNPPD